MSERPLERRLAIVTDFDGTACLEDVGDALCARLAPAAYRRFEQALESGQTSLRDAQAALWPQVEAHAEQLQRVLETCVHLRPGFAQLCRWAARNGVALWIASGGFRFYIEYALRRLEPRTRAHIGVIANEARYDPVSGRFRIAFAPRARYGCARCSVCKAKVIRMLQRRGYRTLFCGDGRSDRCALGVADRLFVVEHSSLHRLARSRELPHIPFATFDTVIAAGRTCSRSLDAAADGDAPGPSDETMTANG